MVGRGSAGSRARGRAHLRILRLLGDKALARVVCADCSPDLTGFFFFLLVEALRPSFGDLGARISGFRSRISTVIFDAEQACFIKATSPVKATIHQFQD